MVSHRLSLCPLHLSYVHPSVCISVLDECDNLSKYQWIFTKLGICIDIVQVWFGIVTVMGKFCYFLT